MRTRLLVLASCRCHARLGCCACPTNMRMPRTRAAGVRLVAAARVDAVLGRGPGRGAGRRAARGSPRPGHRWRSSRSCSAPPPMVVGDLGRLGGGLPHRHGHLRRRHHGRDGPAQAVLVLRWVGGADRRQRVRLAVHRWRPGHGARRLRRRAIVVDLDAPRRDAPGRLATAAVGFVDVRGTADGGGRLRRPPRPRHTTSARTRQPSVDRS
jgi:hypothetical protein